MSLKSKLKGAVIAGLVGLASLGIVKDSKAMLTIGYGFYDTNGVAAGTNLVLNTPYRLGVSLNTTNEPITNINNADWDVRMPGGAKYTNIMSFTGATLPSGSQDFFNGFSMDGTYNHVDSAITNGVLDDNVRLTQNPLVGPANRLGLLGWYDFTPTALTNNQSFNLQGVAIYSTEGTAYTVANGNLDRDQPLFNVIPEPATDVIFGLGLGAWALRRRLRRNVEMQHSRNTGRKI